MSMTRPFARHNPRHAASRARTDEAGRPVADEAGNEISVVDDLRAVPEQDIAGQDSAPPAPSFTWRELTATAPQAVLADGPVTAEPEADEDHPLMRALKDLKGLDFGALDEAKATPGLTYADALARRPAAPERPAARPAGFTEGVIKGMLISALWDAAKWYRDLDGQECENCGDGYLCDPHIDYLALAQTYETLHDFALAAWTDEAALERVTAAIRAGNGRPRTASVSDLGSPGSPLAAILERELDGGAA